MKTIIKVLIVSLIFLGLIFSIGNKSYIKDNKDKLGTEINPPKRDEEIIENDEIDWKESKEPENYNTLEEAFNHSKRVNFLILGLEELNSDTIMLASMCQNEESIDLISLPRDTYIHRKGYDAGEQRKINAVYYNHGIAGVKKTVSYILKGIPIHHYLILDYEGVEAIVDTVGGVEIDVPFHMKYDDPYSNPPLHIDIPAGRQTLNGKMALDFIRYRQGNQGGGYPDGDLGRIRAHQEFLKSFATRAKKNILSLIPSVLKYVETDVSILKALGYGKSMLNLENENINFILLPGSPEFRRVQGKRFSYYIYDKEKIDFMLKEIYRVVEKDKKDSL